MELEELLNAMELESPAEFGYFEHFADLVELEPYIDHSDFYTVLSEAPSHVLEDLSQNYFEDILANLPDDIIDIYTLLVSIQKCLTGLAAVADTPEGRRAYVDELYKFRCWYIENDMVTCTDLTNDRICDVSIGEAIAHCRMEKLGEGTYQYDFSRCMDYHLDEYAVNVGKITAHTADSFDDTDEPKCHGHSHHHRDHGSSCHESYQECSCGDHHQDCDDDGHNADHQDFLKEAYTTGLVDPLNPVIDGEACDEDEDDSHILI